MNSRQAVLALLFGSAALPAPAQVHIVVKSQHDCPDGTLPSVPAYNWKDGRVVLEGWVCESLDNPRN